MLYRNLQTALQYYQLALDQVNNLIWNISRLPALSLPQSSANNISPKSLEINQDLPPLVAVQAVLPSASKEAHKHDLKPDNDILLPPPALTTSFVEAQCHNSSMTSFIGPLESPVSRGDSPSQRLQRCCPICFPSHRPAAFDR